MMPFTSHKLLESQTLRAFDPPIEVQGPPHNADGLIIASPHSGRNYPKAFIRRAALPLSTLRRNEDAFMDEAVAPLAARGIPLLKAHFPRCYVDVNRAADELPPEWSELGAPTTARGAAGLGVIPTMISERLAIYKTPLPKTVVQARIDELYTPYHRALHGLLEAARNRAGHALLLDCHSMPGVSASGRPRHDIILGDRFGASASPELVALTEKIFTQAGYRVARNYPYAGGYVTSTYGQPHNGVSVIQIEVNRNIYMNPASFKLTSGFKRLQACFIDLAAALRAHMRPSVQRAAE
jgi:N-formylglutamate deformylase